MSELSQKNCVPCREDTYPLARRDIKDLQKELGDGWKLVHDHHLTKVYRFEDFAAALDFVNKVGALAEEQDHHPEITLSWGKVRVDTFTHKIDGLTENDFIFAAKADLLL